MTIIKHRFVLTLFLLNIKIIMLHGSSTTIQPSHDDIFLLHWEFYPWKYFNVASGLIRY